MFSVKYPSVIRKNKGISPARLPFILLISVLALAFTTCGEGDSDRRRADHEYLPLKRGWFQIYDVEETRYQLGNPETQKYKLKSVVADSFLNAEGGHTYLIHLSRKPDGSETWIGSGTLSARVNEKEAVVSENAAFVVLAFPAVPGTSWNGNAYNELINPNTNTTTDVYEVESVGAQTVNGLEFSDCVTVVQEDNGETIVFKDQRREVYARNIGLISKETTQLYYCNDQDRNCVGQEIIDEGIIYKQQISSYGVE